ncbi:hypothetical protein OUZ56_019662 [Daphnia magna]|uniref:Uncharacterized protein n=1 Tax=Daphnia magna TaxID=35525 RepID=A0ABQ9ZC76_9CRUS|nr:hypothetical protein OUZ56_019662 [Daphnia magna]
MPALIVCSQSRPYSIPVLVVSQRPTRNRLKTRSTNRSNRGSKEAIFTIIARVIPDDAFLLNFSAFQIYF